MFNACIRVLPQPHQVESTNDSGIRWSHAEETTKKSSRPRTGNFVMELWGVWGCNSTHFNLDTR